MPIWKSFKALSLISLYTELAFAINISSSDSDDSRDDVGGDDIDIGVQNFFVNIESPFGTGVPTTTTHKTSKQ